MTEDACICPKDDQNAQGRCLPCHRLIRRFMEGLLDFGLNQTKLAKSCNPCVLGQMDETLAIVMREFAADEPTAERREAISQIVGGFLMTAPLPSSDKIRGVLAEWTSGFGSQI